MRDMMSALLDGALDEELGYSKYDYNWRIEPSTPESSQKQNVFPSDDSLLKMLYAIPGNYGYHEKWTDHRHRQDWDQIHSQLEIYFEERLIGRKL